MQTEIHKISLVKCEHDMLIDVLCNFCLQVIDEMKKEKRIERIERQINQIAKIQTDRQIKEQELGWLFRPLALCPFPAKPLKSRVVVNGKEVTLNETIWQRKASKLTISITADPRYGIPYGQDILIVLYLAIEARRQGSRKIVVNFYRDLMEMFGINANSGYKYKAVQASMTRIRNALYKWEIEQGPTRETGGNYLYIEEWDLYFDPKNPQQPPLWDQYILLSERFWHEINTHKIPFNLEAARHLKTKPAHLNFYLWLSYRVWNAWNERPGEEVPIPYWGDFGIQDQMSSVIDEKRNFRIQVKNWLEATKEIWPLCPVKIMEDSLNICVTSANELDVLPKDTDAPRILPGPKKLPQPNPTTDTCPQCGRSRTLKVGKIKNDGARMPNYWECSGGCGRTPADAVCRECSTVMVGHNVLKRRDYSYTCPKCGHVEAGEAYWLKYSVSV